MGWGPRSAAGEQEPACWTWALARATHPRSALGSPVATTHQAAGATGAQAAPPSTRKRGLCTGAQGSHLPLRWQRSPPQRSPSPMTIPHELGPMRARPLPLFTPHLHQRRAQSKDAHGQKVLLQPHLHRLVTWLQKERASLGPAPPHQVPGRAGGRGLTAFHHVPGACSPQLSLNSRQQESGTRVAL